MLTVSSSLDQVFTSNVSSGTISIIELVSPPASEFGPPPGNPPGKSIVVVAPDRGFPAPGGPPPGSPRKTWRVTNIAAGRGAEGFDVSPDKREIWAANAQDATVTIIDVLSKKVTETFPISVRGANRLKFTPDGKRVVISGLGGGENGNLAVLDVSTHKPAQTFDLGGGAAGILIVPDGSHAYVAVSAKDKVAVVDLKKLEVTGYVPTGRQPDGLAWAHQE